MICSGHCPCVERFVRFVENGRLHEVVLANLDAINHDHPGAIVERFRRSIAKRLTGALRGLIRQLLEVLEPATYDPYHKHCPTCACEGDLVQRSQGQRRREAIRA